MKYYVTFTRRLTYFMIVFLTEGTTPTNHTNYYRSRKQSSYNGHPLDPLSASEIETTKQIIDFCFPSSNGWLFNQITLKEPPKALIAPYFYKNEEPPRGSIQRQAFCVTRQKGTRSFVEVVVNLDGSRSSIVSTKTLGKEDQPFSITDDRIVSRNICYNDPEFLRRCRDLGYNDPPNSIFLTLWTMAYVGDQPRYKGKRLIHYLPYGMNFKGDNIFAHPFPFTVVVDVFEGIILDFLENPCRDDLSTNNTGVNVTRETANYDKMYLPKDFYRSDLKPIKISFPQGTSYTVSGNQIKWQKFSFRVGFNLREGLLLHLVSYNDSGKVRPLIYRASISEMWVPYGDPRLPTGPRRAVFDEGEYGLGSTARDLNIGEDCVGGGIHDITFFDGVIHDDDGNPSFIKRAICIREEDAGVLWRHTDQVTNRTSIARSRRLGVSFIVRAGNYEYYFHWYFYQDASIQLDIELTGILSTNLLALGSPPSPYASQMSDQVVAQLHQHIFCARVDSDFDGPLNSISTVDIVASPHALGTKQNYYGNGIIVRQVKLNTTKEGVTDTSPNTSRVWKITNDNKLHPITKKPVGWDLKPANSAPPIWNVNSPAIDRARFVTHAMWVTPYKDGQLYAAGDYIGTTDGLPQWVEKKPRASIVNKDIVLWHVFGATHNPRIEDWPVMPVDKVGFWLKPYYFFKQNPALDVPNLHKKCSRKKRKETTK